MRRIAQGQAMQQIEQDSRNAILTFQVVQQQHQIALSRKADLLASLAFMQNGDATAIDGASEDPWQSDECNLFVLADKKGKIVALDSTKWAFPRDAAQEMMLRSVSRGETSGWWFGGGNLYQVALTPFYSANHGAPSEKNLQGFVVLGRLIDERDANDLGRIASVDIAFRYGAEITASTLSSHKQLELLSRFRGRIAPSQLSLDGERYYGNDLELSPAAHPVANLLVLKSYAQADADLKKLNHVLLGLGLIVTFAGVILIFVISNTVTRPLASLVQGVQALEQGDFSYPLEADGHDELSSLTKAFTSMRATLQKNEAQREQLEGQLRQAQKMEALGRLAGGVAHDFNNLLTVIKGHSEILLDRLGVGGALCNNAAQIGKTADRAASLTRQLLAFSRMQVLQTKVLDVNELITDMGKLLRRLIREDIEFSLQLGDSLGRVKADPGQLEQVLMNLAVNGSDAMPLGGKLTIETQHVVIDEQHARLRPSVEVGEYVLVSVADTGLGMDAATKARIFEPFFTTKELGKGTGLGLATVYGVVKQSGGFIWVESEPGCGTRFELYFPRSNDKEDAKVSETTGKGVTVGGKRKTVLVVEDEKDVRELACQFLTAAGYSVLTAEDGWQALEIAERMGESIEAVLTDVVMPRMRGPELGEQLKARLPHIRLVYMTGYLERNDASGEFLEEALVIQKPFSRENLLHTLGQALNNEPLTKLQVETTTAVGQPPGPNDRRTHPRYRFCVDVEIDWESSTKWGCVRDISSDGMFIEMVDCPWVNATFSARLALNTPLTVECSVRRVVPGRGIGVTIATTDKECKKRFRALLRALRSNAGAARIEAGTPSEPCLISRR